MTATIPDGTSAHLVLQGKGGVGKSLVATILAQYFTHHAGRQVHCVDTDPVNQTFAQYKDLTVKRLELLVDGVVDQRVFDDLMERLLTEQGLFVVDNGSSTFIPMWSYIFFGAHEKLPSDTQIELPTGCSGVERTEGTTRHHPRR